MAKKAGTSASVVMRSRVEVQVGDIMFYPYSIAVAAGEPSRTKDFHAQHHNEKCKVLEIQNKSKDSVYLKVVFPNGDTWETNTDFLIFVRRPRRRKKAHKFKKKLAKKVAKKRKK